MKILAIDTSTEACSAALLAGEPTDPGAWHRRFEEAPRGHAELILPMVDALLAEAGVALRELDAIAFGRGPGSFTGVRLAASVVQGLAFGAGVGVVPVSTLQATALRALLAAPASTHVLVCNDARMDEVYTAAFARGPVPQPLGGERVVPPGEVTVPQGGATWIGVGRGFRAYPELAVLGADRGGPLIEIFGDLLPRAEEMLSLAIPEVVAGRVQPATAALPIYVRDNVAIVPAAPKGALSAI